MNIKTTLITLLILSAFFTGCSNSNTKIKEVKKVTVEEYVIGFTSAKHKLVYEDYDRAASIIRKIVFYLDSLNDKIEFNLCEMDPNYKEDISRLSYQGDLTYVKNFNKHCNSHLQLIDNTSKIIAKYEFNWYRYLQDTGSADINPLTAQELEKNVTMTQTITKFPNGDFTSWKLYRMKEN